jgi:outer membrane lipoprotein-sorting protein
MRAILLLGVLALAQVAAAATTLQATQPLVDRLSRSGRAETRITQTIRSDEETLRSAHGRLALEPPDRLRIDFDGGERVTMRKDGGEWVQPAAQQMLVLKAGQAQAAVSIWKAFLSGGTRAFHERALGAGRYQLVARDSSSGLPDSARVEQGADGLPERIELWVGEERWSLRLGHWTFAHARGDSAFKLRAPAGYQVFDWP